MNPDVIIVTVIAVVILMALILAEQPIWIALASSGGIGLILLTGTSVAASAVGAAPFNATANYALVIIPMYVLMGTFASRAGIAEDIFAVSERAARRLPGGLGIATILACGGFSAVTGSSSATVASIGKIAVEQMTRRGYRADAAAALVALGGTLGVLIPPSIIVVVYASLTGESVGRLLLACIIPAAVTITAYSVMTIILFKRGFFAQTEKERRLLASFESSLDTKIQDAQGGAPAVASASATVIVAAPESGGTPKPVVTRRNVIGAIYVAVLFIVVMGGMYSGLFTATESGAVAAAIALVIMLIRSRRKGLRGAFSAVKESTVNAASLTGMIFALLAGGMIFAFFLVRTGLPNELVRQVSGANLPPLLVVVIALLIMIILGCFLDALSVMIITVPLLFPLIDSLGVDAVWFGILVVKAIEIGLVTPPFGINVFVASSTSPIATPEGIFKAVLPMVLSEFVVIAVLIAFPVLVTGIPDLVFGPRL